MQSSIGPLVRMLRQIDPKQKWKIKLTEQTKNEWRPIRYYKERGYNIELVEGDAFDVWVTPKITPSSQLVCFDQKRFAEHHCCVIANTTSFKDKPIFYQVHPASIPAKNRP